MSNRKNKKMSLGSEQKSKPQLPPPQAVESTYQVPTSNILFKDLDTKKIQISEKDYNDLIESSKEMSKMMTELNKYNIRSSAILRKLQNLNNPKDDSKPRDLFNIKVIEVSDDVKSSK
jgi:allophanate hydrolase subunit 1